MLGSLTLLFSSVYGTFCVGVIDVNATDTRAAIQQALQRNARESQRMRLLAVRAMAASLSLDFHSLSVVLHAITTDDTDASAADSHSYLVASFSAELLWLRRHELSQIALQSAKINQHLYQIGTTIFFHSFIHSFMHSLLIDSNHESLAEQSISSIQAKWAEANREFQQFVTQYRDTFTELGTQGSMTTDLLIMLTCGVARDSLNRFLTHQVKPDVREQSSRHHSLAQSSHLTRAVDTRQMGQDARFHLLEPRKGPTGRELET